jgi:hypothetical protein
MVIGAQANQVARSIDLGDQCAIRKLSDAALVANLDMGRVATNAAPER